MFEASSCCHGGLSWWHCQSAARLGWGLEGNGGVERTVESGAEQEATEPELEGGNECGWEQEDEGPGLVHLFLQQHLPEKKSVSTSQKIRIKNFINIKKNKILE